MKCLLVLALVGLAHAAYVPVPPYMSLIEPQGLRMSIPDEPGVSLFAVHYSVNKPVQGTDAGDYNADVTQKTGDEWVYENTAIVVNIGDIVYYWTYVISDGLGYQLLNQQWGAVAPTASPPPPASTSPPPTTTTSATTTTATTTTTAYTGPTTTTAPIGTVAPTIPPPDEVVCTEYPCLVFNDDFNSLNYNNWQHEITAGGGGNWEFQYYTNNRTNSYTRNGVLSLKPTLTEDTFGPGFVQSGLLSIWGSSPANLCTGNAWYGCERAGNPTNYINPIQSARLRSVYGFNVKYGRVEVRAQMPKGDWLWPAIWMLPTHSEYGEWPASGEIDLVESRGNNDLQDESSNQMGNTHMGATLHYGPFMPYNGYEKATTSANGNYGDAFHVFSVDWDDTHIAFQVDGTEILNVAPPTGFWDLGDFGLPAGANPWTEGGLMAPFDKTFYIVMNVAVGGTNGFFSDSWTNAGYPKPWLNTSPTGPKDFWDAKDLWYPTWTGDDVAMKVDYVRVFKMQPDPA